MHYEKKKVVKKYTVPKSTFKHESAHKNLHKHSTGIDNI